MKIAKYILPIALATLTVSVAMAKKDKEEKISLREAPEAVQQSVNTFLGLLPKGAKLDELTMETEDKATVYEAEFEVPHGGEYEVEFNEEGKIIEIESENDHKDDDDDDDD